MHTGQHFDRNGEAGLKGHVVAEISGRYFNLPLFMRGKRRSFDWQVFPPLEQNAATLNDGAATLAYITAKTIADSFTKLPEKPKTMVVSGGGSEKSGDYTYIGQSGYP